MVNITTLPARAEGSELKIHFIDLKSSSVKGDAVLLESRGEYLLVDTGDKDESNTVVNYLKALGVTRLDVFVSHFHSDHFGELDDISGNFNIRNLYVGEQWIIKRAVDQGDAVTDKEYSSVKASMEKFYGEVGIKVKSNKGKYCQNFVEVKPGSAYGFGACRLDILPLPDFNLTDFTNDSSSDPGLTETRMEHYINNMSLAFKLTTQSGDKTIYYLSCGDAEVEEEKFLIDRGVDLKADIWKMNHHGTDTSNSAEFIKAVAPAHSVANHYVIEKEITRQNKIYKKCKVKLTETAETAKKTLYGLIRTRTTMETAEKYGEVYRTEFNGNVIFTVSEGSILQESESGFRMQDGKWYLYWNGQVVLPNSKGFITGFNGSLFKADKTGALKKGMFYYNKKRYYCYGSHNCATIGAGWIKYKGKKYYNPEYFPYLAMGWKKIDGKNYLFDENSGEFIRKQRTK